MGRPPRRRRQGLDRPALRSPLRPPLRIRRSVLRPIPEARRHHCDQADRGPGRSGCRHRLLDTQPAAHRARLHADRNSKRILRPGQVWRSAGDRRRPSTQSRERRPELHDQRRRHRRHDARRPNRRPVLPARDGQTYRRARRQAGGGGRRRLHRTGGGRRGQRRRGGGGHRVNPRRLAVASGDHDDPSRGARPGRSVHHAASETPGPPI